MNPTIAPTMNATIIAISSYFYSSKYTAIAPTTNTVAIAYTIDTNSVFTAMYTVRVISCSTSAAHSICM